MYQVYTCTEVSLKALRGKHEDEQKDEYCIGPPWLRDDAFGVPSTTHGSALTAARSHFLFPVAFAIVALLKAFFSPP